MDPEPAPTPSGRGSRRRGLAPMAAVLVAVALAGCWPAWWAHSNSGLTALLGVGVDGPARALVQEEIPDTVLFPGLGHDGQQFYAVARHPFDPAAARDHLDSPAYRYRRILLPAVAGLLAPDGGRPLVAALLGVSLAGVLLGAWATTRYPGAPAWLPLAVGLTPGVGVALSLSLSDALATGIVLATLAAAFQRRWALVVLGLTAAALTRETLLLVALGLALTPGLAPRWRVAVLGIPIAVAGAWAAWSAHALGTPSLEGAGQIGAPLEGWLLSNSRLPGLLVGLGSTLVLGLGAWRCARRRPEVAAVLGLHTLLMLVLAPDVTTSWLNTTRVAAPVFALAVWAVVAPHDEPRPAVPVARPARLAPVAP